MKVAVTSSAFAGPLRRGEITHLEWLEACASRLDLDGVVLALDDLPRTDLEYAAQVKKVAIDLGLVPVALDVPGLLDPELPDGDRAAALELAAALGAGLVRVSSGPRGELPPETFARTVAAGKTFAGLAKAANITLTVAPVAGALLAGVADVQKFAKFVDSAWLRYDLPAAIPARELLGGRDRVLVERVGLAEDIEAVARLRRGWFVLEGDGGDEPFVVTAAAIARLRAAPGAVGA